MFMVIIELLKISLRFKIANILRVLGYYCLESCGIKQFNGYITADMFQLVILNFKIHCRFAMQILKTFV